MKNLSFLCLLDCHDCHLLSSGPFLLSWHLLLSPVFDCPVQRKEDVAMAAKKEEEAKKPKILQGHLEFYANLGNPEIFSAMAMAMSIYRTLCVLVTFVPYCLSFIGPLP